MFPVLSRVICFGEVSLRSFWPYSNWVIYFLPVGFFISFGATSFLSDTLSENIFSLSMAHVFCPLKVLFKSRLSVYFNRVQLTLWSVCELEVCCLIPENLGTFQLSLCYCWLNSIVLGKHILYDAYFKNVKVWFTAQNAVHPDDLPCELEKKGHAAVLE